MVLISLPTHLYVSLDVVVQRFPASADEASALRCDLFRAREVVEGEFTVLWYTQLVCCVPFTLGGDGGALLCRKSDAPVCAMRLEMCAWTKLVRSQIRLGIIEAKRDPKRDILFRSEHLIECARSSTAWVVHEQRARKKEHHCTIGWEHHELSCQAS